MKRFTIGVTTHNEAATIERLLGSLNRLASDQLDILVYDDCSSDDTVPRINAHPIAARSHSRCVVAAQNHGGPALGRQFIADHARTEYVILVDGDDLIDIPALHAVLARVDPGMDLIITPYLLRGKCVKMLQPTGPVEVEAQTVTSIISGIGGKIYRREVLSRNICHDVVGKSEDARLNLNLLLAGSTRIQYIAAEPFYLIQSCRKSETVSQLRHEEIALRVARFDKLLDRYPIDRRYLFAVKKRLCKVIEGDPNVDRREKQHWLDDVNRMIRFQVKRIVLLSADLSLIGGVPARIQKILRHAGTDD